MIMIYDDGFSIDDDRRFTTCPKCGNEEYSENAEYCRICGFDRYNYCEGTRREDEFGEFLVVERHKNCGNARFCEICGARTVLYSEDILVPYIKYLNSKSFEI